LPAFLTGDGASITGTVPVTQTTDFSFKVRATNSVGYDEETVTVHVNALQPPVITSALSVTRTAGTNFSYTVTASGSPVITYGVSNLPDYLSFNGSTITGTLPSSATAYQFSFTATATNSVGSDSKNITVTVNPDCEAPTITSSSTCNVSAGGVSSYTITAIGSPTIVCEAISASLPSWASATGSKITFNAPYELIGATYTITVKAVNDYGFDSKDVVLSIVAPEGTVTTNDGSFDSDDDVPAIHELTDIVDDNFDTVLTGMDLIISLLEQIKNNTSDGSFEGDDTTLPDYDFDTDWGEFTVPYTDEEKKEKATITQFTFLNDKFAELLAVQPGEAYKFEVDMVAILPGSFNENPYIIISQNDATSIYIAAIRMFFSLILYIVGLFWWTRIIMGYFA
jgi:hypothetical protein